MAEPTRENVKGRFEGETFSGSSGSSTFLRRENTFLIKTDQGELPVAYTFGVSPLQQYLIRQPGGRLQAFNIAWDTRPASAGGQRWFDLYPRETLKPGDPLHWTGLQQNWNFMCADCHSTRVQKGYDDRTREFHTTWSEISVGCEACHGPGSTHASAARSAAPAARGGGLTARLDERRGVQWTFDAAIGKPVRSSTRESEREIEVCARCHARRAQLTDAWTPGDRFEDGFRPVFIEPALFYADGRQKDEVYTYTSFLQSRMYAAGVTCADCHDPHSGRPRAEGNALCTRCHLAAKFDAPGQHFYKTGSEGASCVSCHMPTRTYMEIDPRHDHSLRIPRPVPPAAPRDSAIARASALAQMAQVDSAGLESIDQALKDSVPSVRRGALIALSHAAPADRLRLAPGRLSDPIRTVRVQAALCLADIADRLLAGDQKIAFDHAFDELAAELRFNADRPEAQTSLGTVWLARERPEPAMAAFREAITLDPSYVPAYVNLADALRAQNDDAAAERLLRDGLLRAPGHAPMHHALGLTLVRQKQPAEALSELAEAARLDPDSARFSFVYAVALHDTGKKNEALAVLRAALKTHPNDADLRQALEAFGRQLQ